MSPIANMLIQIKNAQVANHERALVPFSKIKFQIAQVLNQAGFVGEIEKRKKKARKSEFTYIDIKLKNDQQSQTISDVKMISKPSRRIYAHKKNLRPVKNGYGIAIVSTSKGLMTGKDAAKAGLGGELICEIW